MGTLPEYQYTFLIISHSVLLRMRDVADKRRRENQNTHFMFNNFFCQKIENVQEYGTAGQATYGNKRIRVIFWIPKVTNTDSECEILIAFSL
jgi:hypothetical protein